MEHKAWKVIPILYFMLISLSFSLVVDGDQVTIQDNISNCPRNCQCKGREVRCSQPIDNQDLSLPENTKLLAFENTISCSEEELQNLRRLVTVNQISVEGRCNKPEHLVGTSLSKLIQSNQEQTQHARYKRSNFTSPSIYNFTEVPVVETSCNFDTDMCGWTQPTIIDFFDWTRQKGSTPSVSTGPSSDHTLKSGAGYYIYTEASSPRVVGEYADLISPPLALASNRSAVEIKFYFHSYGGGIGKLQIYAMYPRISTSIYSITNVSLYSTDRWRAASTTFYPQYSPYRVMIRGVVGTTFTSDIAVDDIYITSKETACYVANTEVYRGTTSAANGVTSCRSWSSVSNNFTTTNYPNSDLRLSYCRNPGGLRSRPWCYVTSTAWDYCNVPLCTPPSITTSKYPLGSRYPVVLTNTDEHNELKNLGRVAIYHNGQWGSICEKFISDRILNLLCKQAGFPGIGSRQYRSYVSTGKIWLDHYKISCPSNAVSLNDCTLGPWGSTLCSHTGDLWLRCKNTTMCSSCTTGTTYTPPASTSYVATSTATMGTPFQLSIQGGSNSSHGYITVKRGSETGVMCASNWDIDSADVVCRQLGYLAAFSSTPALSPRPSGYRKLISRILCKGYETSIDSCSIGTSTSICPSYNVDSISCYRGQSYYTLYNKPEYCSFRNGLCGWKSDNSWIWHPATSRHYGPMTTYYTYAYVYKPYRSTTIINAVLTSPIFTGRRSTTYYVAFSFYVKGFQFDRLQVSYSLTGSTSESYIFDRKIRMPQTYWSSVTTRNFFSSSNFQIKFICASLKTSSASTDGAVGIRNVILRSYGSSGYINVPGIAIGCSVSFMFLILIIAVSYTKYRRRRLTGGRVNMPTTVGASSVPVVPPPPAYPVTMASQTPGITYTAGYAPQHLAYPAPQAGSTYNNQSNYAVSYSVNGAAQQQLPVANSIGFTAAPPQYYEINQNTDTTHITDSKGGQ